VLKKVTLSIHSSENRLAESAIEAYSFNFTYVGDECSENVQVLLEKTQRMEIDAEQSSTVDNKEKGKVVCSPSYPCRKVYTKLSQNLRERKA
jgi:hypothetical protein